jgi:uncharacterized membrane protein
MEFINNQLYRWFGMNLYTALQILIIGLAILFAVAFVFGVVGLIADPGAANSASWGFAD